jgi:putative PIN family toxin of toxin-antitoxin system
MLIVLDTNVLVSSLLKQEGNPAIILNAILKYRIKLAIDQKIIDEYTEVLYRPRLNIPTNKANSVLMFIANTALWVYDQTEIFQKSIINDPGDLPFAEVAVSSHADVLVTGNIKHFKFMLDTGVKVHTPQEFLAKYHITPLL